MSEKANDIIEQALAALRAEASDIHNKISALEGALSKKASAPRRAAPAPKKPTNGRRKKKASAPKEVSKSAKIKEAANKRAASWTPEKKKAAAERMRKYWAERKKQRG